jgi:hypothetical protein
MQTTGSWIKTCIYTLWLGIQKICHFIAENKIRINQKWTEARNVGIVDTEL